MRRWMILALAIALGIAPLAACGKKAVPKLPEGDKLKIEKGLERDLTVEPPTEDQEGAETQDSQGAPEEGVPPSPGGPQEGGF